MGGKAVVMLFTAPTLFLTCGEKFAVLNQASGRIMIIS
jgi:hypothetical protein